MPVWHRSRGQGPSAGVIEITLYILLSAMCGSAPVSAQSVHPNESAAGNIDVSDLLWWLPTDTESVVVARGPFSFPVGSSEPSEKDAEKWFTARATLAQIRSDFEALPLETVDYANLVGTFRGSEVALALQGTRHYREPSHGSEVMSYEGCSIVVFEKSIDQLEPRLRKAPGWENAEKDLIGGTRVLMVRDKSEEGGERYFVAFPLANVFIVANDRGYLQDVLGRIKKRSTLRALPDDLPEWHLLNRTARFWGLRHYDPTQAKLDPTSPLGGDSAYTQGDPKAIGVLFALDPKNERSLAITSFTGDEAKAKAAAAKEHLMDEPQEGVRYEVKLRNPAPGIFQAIYTLDQSSTVDYGILAVQFFLGRGMNF